MSAQAAHEWSGATDNKFSTSGNWGGSKKYNFVFNNTSSSRTLIYLDKNYSGKFKFGIETSTAYHQLIFRAHPANKPWHFCGWYSNAIHSYDNSGSESDCKIVVGDIADTYLRLSAINLKTVTIQVGATGYSGHLIMDEYDADGTTYRGPVTFRTTGTMEFNKGSLHATNAVLTCDGNMTLGNFNATLSGGVLTANQIQIASGSGNAASLTLEGATVTNKFGAVYVCYGSGATGTLYLNEGGTLVARNIYKQNGTASVVFNGGTLKAKSVYTNYGGLLGNTDSMTITVGEKGGTIDNNGLDIAISGNYMQGSGAVTFTGSGSTTLAVAQQYTGGTTIDAGTLLKVNGSAKTALVAHDVTVAIPAGGVPDGTVVLETTDGTTFTQAEVDAMAFSGNDDNRYALELADGGAKVKLVDVRAGEYVWNGGASGDSWKTAGAWTKNGVSANWYDFVAAVFENAGDEATVDSAVAVESITFRASATVTGTATLTVPSVVVSNAVSATISAPTTGALEKTGPGTLTLGSARTAATTFSEGTLTLTGSGQTTAWSNFALGTENAVTLRVADGATLTHSGAAIYLGQNSGQDVTLSIDAGGTVEVRNLFFGDGTGTVVFNGGTLKANQDYSNYGGLIGTNLTVSITENGGTIDNGGYDILVSKDLNGAMSFTGSGTTTIAVDQSATGSMAVNGGTVALNAGLTVARPVTVAAGAALKAIGAATLSGGVEFADGATLDIAGSDAVAASVTFPANGTVTLKRNGGAFAHGLYPILAKTGITAAEVEGKIVPSLASGASAYQYVVKNDTLYLAVDADLSRFVWTGADGDGKMSTGGNWWNGVVPGAGDAVDFAGATVNVSVTADIDAAFGAVTMGDGVVTFSGALTAKSFSDTSKIAVAADATVTLDGDLTAGSTLLYSVAAGGKFVVTGTLTMYDWGMPQNDAAAGDGTIVAGGITAGANATIVASCEKHSQKWAVGPGGITGGAGSRLWTYSNAGAAPEFRPWTNDFTISVGSVVRTNARSFTINTTGLDGAGHTITLDAGFADNGDPLNVTGTGKVVVNHVTAAIGDRAAYSGAVEVKDSATLAINAGKTLTSGAMTVESGAALEVAESGEVALGGDLELKDGATLKFNFTDRRTAPKLVLSQTPTFGEVKVDIAGVRPRWEKNAIIEWPEGTVWPEVFDIGSVFTLADNQPKWVTGIAVEGNSLVLTSKPAGTMIILR
jgi:autotransporter-associated beta strand protein